MAFPHSGFWYLIPHDLLIEIAGENTDWLKRSSWLVKAGYSSVSVNPALLARPYWLALSNTDSARCTE